MELIFVRHSIAKGNLRHMFLGRTDTPLTPEGVALARETSARMPAVERVYHSPMLRTTQTASLLWPGTPMEAVAGLREMDFGVFDGFTHEELLPTPVYTQWLAQTEWTGYPGGETFDGIRARMNEAFRYIVCDGQARGLARAGCVAHGGTFVTFMELYTERRINLTDKLVKNCGGYAVDLTLHNGAVKCLGIRPLD